METIVLHWISSEDIAKGYNAPSYERKVREYIRRNNLSICKEYIAADDGLAMASVLSELVQFLNENKTKTFKLLAYKVPPWRVTNVEKCFTDRFSDKTLEFDFLHHECFEEPANHNTPIWRYINLPKLLDIIQTQTLFFTRADKLREFDKFEGQYLTQYSRVLYDAITAGHLQLPPIAEGLSWQQMAEMSRQSDQYNEQHGVKRNFINCWHMAPHENIAMWKIYADIFGVCIQSTYNRLCDSIVDDTWSHYHPKQRVYIGAVKYIDRRMTVIPQNNGFWPYLHKSIGYTFEQELRCIIWDTRDWGNNISHDHLRTQVNNEILIENIFLHPAAPSWYYKNLVTLCAQHGIDRSRIKPSNLA